MLSWFDEDPDMLYRSAHSAGKIADHLIAVDGRYEHFPSERSNSPREQHDVIRLACDDAGMGLTLSYQTMPWRSEVEKRAAMFALALGHAEPLSDWFMVIDADVSVQSVSIDARMALEGTDADCAKVRCRNVRPDGAFMDDVTYRAFYRAIPGLTCSDAHWCYTVPQPNGQNRYMWMTPGGRESEPCADLTEFVTVHHRNLDRDADRSWAARMYYRKRDELTLERAPRW